jgi:hypothetical protein
MTINVSPIVSLDLWLEKTLSFERGFKVRFRIGPQEVQQQVHLQVESTPKRTHFFHNVEMEEKIHS